MFSCPAVPPSSGPSTHPFPHQRNRPLQSYYFGVGGGTAAFARLVAQDGVLECSCAAVLDDGQSNKREILRLGFPAAAAAAAEGAQ